MRKWSEVREAWLNGVPVQYRNFCDFGGIWSKWVDLPPIVCSIYWENPDYEFRIKPEEEELQESYKWFKVCYKNNDGENRRIDIEAKNLEDCKKQFQNYWSDIKYVPEHYRIYKLYESVYQQ
jgi:hypothetical protein